MNELEQLLGAGVQILGYGFCFALVAAMSVGEWQEKQKSRRRERELAKIDEHERFLGIGATVPIIK